jgi:hypothetical protein
MGRFLLLLLALTIVPAGVAAAATTTTTTTPTTATAPSVKPPTPVHGTLELSFPDAYIVGGQPVTIPGRGIRVAGVVRPFVAHQSVTVKAFLFGHQIRDVSFQLKRSRNGKFGWFNGSVTSASTGEVSVFVGHRATPLLGHLHSHEGFGVVAPSAGFGSVGRFVQLIQQRLAALGFYIPQTGVYDVGTGLALDAYHRLLGWGTSQNLDRTTITWLLNGWGQFKVRYPNHGRHAEGDLTHQVLALIKGSKVDGIFPISSGKPSTPTILGNFAVQRQIPYFRPDGMYFSSYFSGGYAIHGFNPAPDYPASHGCMRLPMVDAVHVYNWLAVGDGVDVYYR